MRARARHENALGENPVCRAPSRARRRLRKRRHSDHFGMCARRPRRSVRGHAAASRGADGAAKRAGRGRQAKARAARMRNALVSASEVSLPPTGGQACRACGAAKPADSASRVCARCALPLRAALESTMGLKSVVIARSRVWAARRSGETAATDAQHGLSPPRRIVRFVFEGAKNLSAFYFPSPPVPSWFAPTPRTRYLSASHPRCAPVAFAARAPGLVHRPRRPRPVRHALERHIHTASRRLAISLATTTCAP